MSLPTLTYVETALWVMFATVGFALLFNVPKRYLPYTLGLAAIGYTLRAVYVESGGHLVIGSLIGSVVIGLLGAGLSRVLLRPSPLFTYPAIIPMIPGVYAYKGMYALLQFLYRDNPSYELLVDSIQHTLNALFIFLALAIGVAFTSVILGRSSSRRI